MRARFFMLALACAASAAVAQVPWPPVGECAEGEPLRPLPAVQSRPICTPQQIGGSGITVIEGNERGGAIAFWCKQKAPKEPILYLYAVEWDALTRTMLLDAVMLGLPGDNRARIQAMQARHQTRHVFDMCDVWWPAKDRITAARPK